MATQKLNKYRLSFADNTSESFVASTMRAAVNANETDARPLAQVVREETAIGVDIPARNVKFETVVSTQDAINAGCRATPETWIVEEDTNVIFTALPAAGFKFDGWFAKGEITPLSLNLVAELPVPFPADPAATAVVFEAHFSPIP